MTMAKATTVVDSPSPIVLRSALEFATEAPSVEGNLEDGASAGDDMAPRLQNVAIECRE